MASHSESALTGALVSRAALESCRRLEALVRQEPQRAEPSRAFHWSTFFDQLEGDAPEHERAPLMTVSRPRRPPRIVGYSAHEIVDTAERALPPLALTVLGMAAMGAIGLSSAWLPGTDSEWALGDSLLVVDEAQAAPVKSASAAKKAAPSDRNPDRLQAFASVQPLGHGAMVLSKDWPMLANPALDSSECQMSPVPRG